MQIQSLFPGEVVCYADRKDSKKRSFAKYAKLLTSTPKFVKEVKRGIYLATLFYTKDDKILVTLDDNLPIVEVDDSSCGSFMQEFQWLLKVRNINYRLLFTLHDLSSI